LKGRLDEINLVYYAVARWRATDYVQFTSMSLDDVIQRRLGTRRRADTASSSSSGGHVSRLVQLRGTDDDDQVTAIEFDARRRWPHHIRLPVDQQDCAASWIYSAAGLFRRLLHRFYNVIINLSSKFYELFDRFALDCFECKIM